MQINVHHAKTQLSRLLDRAAAGEEIVIARAGKPVARLVALDARREPRKLGQFTGQPFEIAGDFDELPDDMLLGFEEEST
ncbi:MAG: type II toxin-antitoxin system Phd/YefM family antitoxin [Deltaproteobacteria bacterium]|nr:type II toxin-antitoxin system Phd/YefM family antitoxin [Deltaproteobacteria bacterium]